MESIGQQNYELLLPFDLKLHLNSDISSSSFSISLNVEQVDEGGCIQERGMIVENSREWYWDERRKNHFSFIYRSSLSSELFHTHATFTQVQLLIQTSWASWKDSHLVLISFFYAEYGDSNDCSSLMDSGLRNFSLIGTWQGEVQKFNHQNQSVS